MFLSIRFLGGARNSSGGISFVSLVAVESSIEFAGIDSKIGATISGSTTSSVISLGIESDSFCGFVISSSLFDGNGTQAESWMQQHATAKITANLAASFILENTKITG